MKKEKGITLVALVVTIIILIILAGISISLVLGDNGIVTKAKLAKQNTLLAQEEENSALTNYDKEIEEALNDNLSTLIPRFTPTIEDNNGISVQISANAPAANENDIVSYTYLLNGSAIEETTEPVYQYQNLQTDTDYTIAVIAKDVSGNTRKSNDLKVRTDSKVYLYKEGKEYEDITGGWMAAINCGDGTLTKDPATNYMMYTCSGGGWRFGSIASSKKIKIQGYNKLYVSYNTTAPANRPCGFSTIQTYNGSTLGFVDPVITLNNDGQDHTDFIENFADTIDTSEEYYIQFYFNGDYGAVNCKVYNIWLEK